MIYSTAPLNRLHFRVPSPLGEGARRADEVERELEGEVR